MKDKNLAYLLELNAALNRAIERTTVPPGYEVRKKRTTADKVVWGGVTAGMAGTLGYELLKHGIPFTRVGRRMQK